MPLQDHFQPPLATQRHWESFHAAWASEIMRTLNRKVLPPNCFAETQVHVGSRVGIDVATFDQQPTLATGESERNGGGVAVATWAPPVATLVLSTIFPGEIEVQVFHSSGGATLVAALELISPRNKDRHESRQAFVAKCVSYLQQGIGLVIVDIVTERLANLRNELVRILEQPKSYELVASLLLYAVAYRPSRQKTGDQIEIWPTPLAIGQFLPVLPLALCGAATVPLALEITYVTTCEDYCL